MRGGLTPIPAELKPVLDRFNSLDTDFEKSASSPSALGDGKMGLSDESLSL